MARAGDITDPLTHVELEGLGYHESDRHGRPVLPPVEDASSHPGDSLAQLVRGRSPGGGPPMSEMTEARTHVRGSGPRGMSEDIGGGDGGI